MQTVTSILSSWGCTISLDWMKTTIILLGSDSDGIESNWCGFQQNDCMEVYEKANDCCSIVKKKDCYYVV